MSIEFNFFPVQEVEKDVKARTKGDLGAAKTLCTPFDQPELPEGTVCYVVEANISSVILLNQFLQCLFSNHATADLCCVPKFRNPVLRLRKASKEVVVLGPQLLIGLP